MVWASWGSRWWDAAVAACVIGVIYWCLIAVFIIGVRGIITGKIIVV